MGVPNRCREVPSSSGTQDHRRSSFHLLPGAPTIVSVSLRRHHTLIESCPFSVWEERGFI